MHQYFIIPGIVDGAKCHADAQERRDDKRHPETSIVHDHRRGEKCNAKCTTYLLPRIMEGTNGGTSVNDNG